MTFRAWWGRCVVWGAMVQADVPDPAPIGIRNVTMTRPFHIGSIGVGGYAASLIRLLDQAIPHERARLAAADVSRSTPEGPVADIVAQHQTARVQGVDALLDHPDLDAVLIATSIDSHLPFVTAALNKGLHVHCEKPITATIQDAREMIAQRDRTGRCVHVGYQDTYGATTQWAKQLILDGAIGALRRVRVMACWPRSDSYYNRNDWAGRLQRDGRWVLDSPANNALAHQTNLALYLGGPTMRDSARAVRVEAELYRARDIENYDTGAFRAVTESGVEILVLLTHACGQSHQPTIDWIGDTGSIHRMHPASVELRQGDHVLEHRDEGSGGPRLAMMENFIDRLEGPADRSLCEIENAMEVTRLINGVSACVPVRTIDSAHVQPIARADEAEGRVMAVRGIESLFAECFDRFALPSEVGAPWAGSPGRLDLSGYERFEGPATD